MYGWPEQIVNRLRPSGRPRSCPLWAEDVRRGLRERYLAAGADGGGRTRTGVTPLRILSPVCLPIPPRPRGARDTHPAAKAGSPRRRPDL